MAQLLRCLSLTYELFDQVACADCPQGHDNCFWSGAQFYKDANKSSADDKLPRFELLAATNSPLLGRLVTESHTVDADVLGPYRKGTGVQSHSKPQAITFLEYVTEVVHKNRMSPHIARWEALRNTLTVCTCIASCEGYPRVA